MYRTWQHAFKIDPDKDVSDEALEALCESGTDAIIVGGSQGVTLDGVIDLLSRVRRYTVPCVLEISTVDSITPGFDGYLIPSVLNSEKREWIIGLHHKAIEAYGHLIDDEEILLEGYCVLNKDAAVAELTAAKTALTSDEVAAYAQLAGRLWEMPVFYVEYSGTFGDMDVLKQAKDALGDKTRLFYGGGIDSAERAKQASAYADTIIVGNILYDDLKAALATVKAVKTL
ncbi:heptaprenylglyceryl phosphate synthase [Aureibacillus halotolerans]|nr:heptaprenylglyceryl phosphate synthase [Aureibacillus halotolerans]